MIISEDGTVTGSIDVSRLDEIEPKTDEAKTQLEALKRDLQLSQDQTQADSQRLAELSAANNPLVSEAPQDQRDPQGKSTGANEPSGLQRVSTSDQKAADQKAADEKKAASQSQSHGSTSKKE